MAARKPFGIAAMLMLATIAGASAQSVTPPTPIPTPPVPPPPQLGPVHKVTFGSDTPPPPPDIQVPDRANLTPVAIPPEPPLTPADKSDPTKPPVSGRLTGPTAMVSPGASESQIEEVAFLIDPGTTQLSQAATAKLGDVAKTLVQNPAARLEVRVFTPSKPHNESNARRLSLSRFLAIRDVLVHDGVGDGRIDGRPLIAEPNELNGDHVELYIER
jgi:outer membrane protein OmpA-like peptidoglycan-associated protein